VILLHVANLSVTMSNSLYVSVIFVTPASVLCIFVWPKCCQMPHFPSNKWLSHVLLLVWLFGRGDTPLVIPTLAPMKDILLKNNHINKQCHILSQSTPIFLQYVFVWQSSGFTLFSVHCSLPDTWVWNSDYFRFLLIKCCLGCLSVVLWSKIIKCYVRCLFNLLD